MTTATPESFMPRVRWSWLWTQKRDLVWNLLPFWLGLALVALLYATRSVGPTADNPMWSFSIAGREFQVMTLMLLFYGPLVDAPHLWATIARTYTDREEWAARRRLFIGSLLAFAIGPIVILLPYALRAVVPLPPGAETLGWLLWTTVFGFYTIFHINKQHWGFVCLYKRKNNDSADETENRVDALYFQTAIWLPYVAMLTAPWFLDNDGKPFSVTQIAVGSMTLGSIVHTTCHAAFLAVSAAYIAYQVNQWRKGIARNGPKLLYVATILSLYYVTFSFHPRIAAFWVLITGTGHCAQYHAVVWAYGRKKYAVTDAKKRSLPSLIFGSVWLYVVLGVVFGLVTMQGPGARVFKNAIAGTLQASLFARAFAFLDPRSAYDLGIKVAVAVVSGVRLHHFYVDSKIWRVSKSAALAKNLNV
jgi:hypothetical protein